MSITKPRGGNRRRRGGRGGGRRAPSRRKEHLRTEAEQLDYEMELLRAQREGREEQFKTAERAKLHARKAQQLDAEMDEYFKKKDDVAEEKEAEKKDAPEANGVQTEKVTEQPENEQPAPTAEAAAT